MTPEAIRARQVKRNTYQLRKNSIPVLEHRDKSVSKAVANRLKKIRKDRKIINQTTKASSISSKKALKKQANTLKERVIKKDPNQSYEDFSARLVSTQPVTYDYALAMITLDGDIAPDYIQNNIKRAEDFITTAEISQEKLLESFTTENARKVLLKEFYDTIARVEKEETEFVRKVSRTLFGSGGKKNPNYNKRMSKKDFIVKMTEVYQKASLELFPNVDMGKLYPYIKYAYSKKIANYFSNGVNAPFIGPPSPKQQEYIDYYEKNKSTIEGDKAYIELKESKDSIIKESGSLAQLRIAGLFDDDPKNTFIDLTSDPSMGWLGGIFYEPISSFIMGQVITDLNDEKTDMKITYKGKVVGSYSEVLEDALKTAGGNFAREQQIKEHFSKPGTYEGIIESGTVLAGDQDAFGKTDLVVTVGIKVPRVIKIDIKNPTGSNKTMYQVNSPAIKLNELDSATSAYQKMLGIDGAVYKDIRFTLAAILQNIFIYGKLNRTAQINKILVLLSLMAIADDRTIESFFGKKQDGSVDLDNRSNLVLVGTTFFYFSDILKAIIKVYFNKDLKEEGDSKLIQSANHTFKFNFADKFSVTEQKREEIYSKKIEVALENKDVPFQSRMEIIARDTDVRQLLDQIINQFMSTSVQQKFTLNLGGTTDWYKK